MVASNVPNLSAESQNGSVIPSNQGGSSMQPTATPGVPTATNPINSILEQVLQSMSQPGASLTPGYGTMGTIANTLGPQVQQIS